VPLHYAAAEKDFTTIYYMCQQPLIVTAVCRAVVAVQQPGLL